MIRLFDTKLSLSLIPTRLVPRQAPVPIDNKPVSIDDIKKVIAESQQGDFISYLLLNGFNIQSTEEHPQPLCMCPEHTKLYKALAAVLYCKSCGRPHGQDFMARATPKSSRPTEITCHHCGQRDCAGTRNIGTEAGQGFGKSVAAAHWIAYLDGLLRYRGYKPTLIATCANKEESEVRLDMLKVIMNRPNHRNCFGARSVPKGRQKRSEVVFKDSAKEKGAKDTVDLTGGGMAFGTPSFPNGKHVDILWMDDVCTQTTSIVKPKDGQNIKTKIEGTVLKCVQPLFTIIVYQSNTWRKGDTTSWMRQWTSMDPTWSWHKVACGGPEDDFRSPCERTLPREHLRSIYIRGDREYERSMMLHEITDEELCFRDPRFYTTKRSMERASVPAGGKSLEDIIILEVDEPEMMPWPKFISIDMGFTGATSDLKNRSKTGIVVGSINPETGMIFILYASESYIAAGDHLAELARLSNIYGTTWIMPDSGAAQNEFVAELERAGYEVTPYNATSLGNKALRKERLCAFWNQGYVRLRVALKRTSAESDAIHKEIYKGQDKVAAAAVSFPAVVTDLLDALEIGCRKAWERHGEPRPETIYVKENREGVSVGVFMNGELHRKLGDGEMPNMAGGKPPEEDINSDFEDATGITAEMEMDLADMLT